MGRMRKASRAIERVLGALETMSGYGTKRSRRSYDKR